MSVTRDRINRIITLSQQAYIEQLLIDHNIDINNITLQDHPCHRILDEHTIGGIPLDTYWHSKYRSIIGGLSYAANMTRTDILYVVNRLSRFLAAPNKYRLKAAIHVLHYLAGTTQYKMKFQSNQQQTTNNNARLLQSYAITAYSDASYADCEDRKSTTGSIVKLYGNTILGKSTKQKVKTSPDTTTPIFNPSALTVIPTAPALSSTEAELYAASQTLCEALWVRSWLIEVYNIVTPILLLIDNQSTIVWCQHDSQHSKVKHIDTRIFFIREHIKMGNVIIRYVNTKENQADILTKTMNNNNNQFNYLVSKNLV